MIHDLDNMLKALLDDELPRDISTRPAISFVAPEGNFSLRCAPRFLREQPAAAQRVTPMAMLARAPRQLLPLTAKYHRNHCK
jgi:hypothetical protein